MKNTKKMYYKHKIATYFNIMDSLNPLLKTDYKNMLPSTMKEVSVFAEIVFVTKTQNDVAPLLYQLQDDVHLCNELFYHAHVSFSIDEKINLLGEIVSIDKQNKSVLLSNKITVRYNYLIAISNNEPPPHVDNHSFNSGLQTLVDALKIRSKIPSSFAPLSKEDQGQSQKKLQSSNQKENCQTDPISVNDCFDLFLTAHANVSNTPDLNTKKLCEVQL